MPKRAANTHRQITRFHVRETASDDEVELSFSSEFPYDRGGDIGTEILSHDETAPDLSRLNSGAPLLWRHDPDRPIGRVVRAWLDKKTKRCRARVKFGVSDLARQVMADVKAGTLELVSCGYHVHDAIRTAAGTIARAWEPFEVSLVTTPVDPTVGVNRHVATPSIQKHMPAETAQKAERRQTRDVASVIERMQERGRTVPAETFRRAIEENWDAAATMEFIDANQPTPELPPGSVYLGRRQGGYTDHSVLDNMQRTERREFSLVRALARIAENKPLDGFEAEMSREMEKESGRPARGDIMVPISVFHRAYGAERNMAAGDFSHGGSLVPTEQGTLIESLEIKPSVERAGARVLNGLVGNVSIPRQTGGATAQWVSEGGKIDASKIPTDDVILSPHGLGGMVISTKQLLRQTTIDVENMMRADLNLRLALGIDRASLIGSGVSGEPKGVFSLSADSGVNELTFGGSPTWAKVVEFETSIDLEDALQGSLAYIGSPKAAGAWKTTSKDTGSGMFLLENDRANGYSFLRTNQAKDTDHEDKVVFGNWSDCLIGRWAGVDLTVDPYTLADEGKVRIVALTLCDIAFRHPESFVRSTDAGNQ